MRWYADDTMLVLFFELTDDLLARIQEDKSWIMDSELIQQCEEAKGRHACAFKMFGDGDVRKLRKVIKESLADYETVSWWNKKMTKFYIRRVLCHS